MSRLGERATQARVGVIELETALEQAERALQAAERVDQAAAAAKRRAGPLLKILIVLGLVGVAVVVIRKVTSGSEPASGPRPVASTPPAEAAGGSVA